MRFDSIVELPVPGDGSAALSDVLVLPQCRLVSPTAHGLLLLRHPHQFSCDLKGLGQVLLVSEAPVCAAADLYLRGLVGTYRLQEGRTGQLSEGDALEEDAGVFPSGFAHVAREVDGKPDVVRPIGEVKDVAG